MNLYFIVCSQEVGTHLVPGASFSFIHQPSIHLFFLSLLIRHSGSLSGLLEFILSSLGGVKAGSHPRQTRQVFPGPTNTDAQTTVRLFTPRTIESQQWLHLDSERKLRASRHPPVSSSFLVSLRHFTTLLITEVGGKRATQSQRNPRPDLPGIVKRGSRRPRLSLSASELRC